MLSGKWKFEHFQKSPISAKQPLVCVFFLDFLNFLNMCVSFKHENATIQSGNVYFYQKINSTFVQISDPLRISCEQNYNFSYKRYIYFIFLCKISIKRMQAEAQCNRWSYRYGLFAPYNATIPGISFFAMFFISIFLFAIIKTYVRIQITKPSRRSVLAMQ